MPSFGHTPLESGCFGLNDDAIYAKNCHSPRVPYPVARRTPLGVPFTSGGLVQQMSTFVNIYQHLSTSINILNFQVVAGVSANGVYQSAQIYADSTSRFLGRLK